MWKDTTRRVPLTQFTSAAEAAMHAERRYVHAISCEDGRHFIIYLADDGWHVLPYPLPLGAGAGDAYDSAEDAEHAVRTRHTGASWTR